MTRPTFDQIIMTDSQWYSKINSNFAKIFEAPFPLFQLTGASPTFNEKAALFQSCIAAYDAEILISTGSAWETTVPQQLLSLSDLDKDTASVSTVASAYNLLRQELISKGWMKSS